MITKMVIKNRKLQYRKSNAKRGEQYSISLPIDMISDMGIDEKNRDIKLVYNPILKEIKIKK